MNALSSGSAQFEALEKRSTEHDRKPASGFGRIAEIAHLVTGYLHERLLASGSHSSDTASTELTEAFALLEQAETMLEAGRAADVTARPPAPSRGRN